jgi:conjugative relaxase-like TrwC/TraI family protein
MLSVAKLRVGQEAYHLSGVAQSLDDYYTGTGEANGVWVGSGSTRLDLFGEVTPSDLQAVLAGLRPGSGGLTPNGDRQHPHPRRVPGFDLTFKAPKSASVLYAVSDDPRVQGAIIEAGEAAMRAAVGWVEREAIRVRRGSHNQAWLARHSGEPGAGPKVEPSNGVVAAAFRHRTSRAGDPLLHWHVLVANLVQGVDGKWSAFLHPELYRNIRAASEVFQSAYRSELTHRLGIEWRPGRHVREIAGVPQALLDQFSKRSHDIEAWLESTGTPNTPEGRQAAVLATRRHKSELEEGSTRFDAAWKDEAEAFGWGPEHADELVGSAVPALTADAYEGVWRLDTEAVTPDGRLERRERIVDPEDWIEHVLRHDLTTQNSTFTRGELTAAIAARQRTGATASMIERVAHRLLASGQLLRVDGADGVDRWTSRELHDVEQRFVSVVRSGTPARVIPKAAVDRAIADRPGLGDDQLASVCTITTSPAPVAVLVGPAGTGKTFTIDAVRAAYEQAGWIVHGAAPSARAALELTAGANVPARTLHSLLESWNRGLDAPCARSLLVVDEAGMADIRTLENVVTRQVGAGGRVLLVGDHRQLPEIGAGGCLEHAVHHGACVAELTVNRRQHHEWEQNALTALRDGRVATAVRAYLEHGRVLTAASPTEMITTAVDRWFEAHDRGLRPVLLAGTNDLVDRLNTAVIDRLVARGELDAETAPYGPAHYGVGQRVVLRRNSNAERTTAGETTTVANGQTGTVMSADHRQMVVRLDHGQDVVLDDRYLRRGGDITHAYALTTHRAQGGTWDRAIAVGADVLYREGAYVQLSRGIDENLIVLTEPEAAEFERQAGAELSRHDHGIVPNDEVPGDLDKELTARLTRSHAKHLAHTLDPDAASVDLLARRYTYPALVDMHRTAAAAERLATDRIGADRRTLTADLERIDLVARHLDAGLSVSPHDRNNVGTVVSIDDERGTAQVHFVSRDGHEATRQFGWEQLRLVDHAPPERTLTTAATRQLARLTDPTRQRIDEWDQLVQSHNVEPGDAHRLSRAIATHTERATSWLVAEHPEQIEHYLGPQPTDPAGATTWLDAARAITGWRLAIDADSDQPGIGRRPEGARSAEWDRLNHYLAGTRVWLESTDRLAPSLPVVPSHGELVARLNDVVEILDTAPADGRHFIAELRSGQLTLDDTNELLLAALAEQDARRTWIVEHWPHIVEHQEITTMLDNRSWGPDPSLLTDLLAYEISDDLEAAIRRGDRWLRAALCRLAEADTNVLSDVQVDLLEDCAARGTESALGASDSPQPQVTQLGHTVDVLGI